MGEASATCEEQYRKTLFYPWAEELSIFPDGIIMHDAVQVWVQIKKLKDAVGNHVQAIENFHNMHCHVLPHQ